MLNIPLVPAYKYPRLAAYIRACLALNKRAGLRRAVLAARAHFDAELTEVTQ